MSNIIFISVVSMMIGQVWIVLIQPDFLFDFMGKYIDMTMKWRKVHHLLICSTCIAGQVSLWWYPFADDHYSIGNHFLVVVITIWLTSTINKLLSS